MNNEHTVLYRKYRPETFDQVLGQDHIVKVLRGSIDQGKVGHAYLFSGPRGTGKTTMARIFAHELGCDETDIIEIDAASNRGIDDIRQLRDGVHSLPFMSKYKMYIIDEVHMLTKEAFNALLKTLEEPPRHVIFVLATTEFHKVLPTVVSRCQSFIFKSPTRTVLKAMSQRILAEEGFTIDTPSLELVALLGNGSFRDTQGVLQKLTSYSTDRAITRDEVELVTGAPSSMVVHELLSAINEGDGDQVFTTLAQAREANLDPYLLVEILIESVRNVLFIRFSPHEKQRLENELDSEDFEVLLRLAGTKNSIDSKLLELLLGSYENMHVGLSKYLALELAMLKVLEQGK